MRHPMLARSTALALLAAVPLAAFAMHGDTPGLTSTEAAKTKWGDPPPVLSKGAKLAVVSGDPGKPGPYVIRVSFPAGYKVAPHWHTNSENVTVISGSVMLGMGDKANPKAMHTYKVGDFFSIAGKTNHYAQAKGASVIQIHGEGPFDLNYVNPDDDPSKKAAAAKQ